MKNFFVFLFLVLVFLISCKSKVISKGNSFVANKEVNYIPYYLKVYEADSLFIVKDYERSYEILDNLFKEYKPVKKSIFYEYITYIKLKKLLNIGIDKTDFIRKIIDFGITMEFVKNDSILNSIYILDTDFYNIEQIKYCDSLKNVLNLSLRDEILKMKNLDQFYRTSRYTDFTKQQDSIDYKNQRRLIDMFETIGFPDNKIFFGCFLDNQSTDLSSILLHSKDSIRDKYFIPKVFEFIKKGDASPLIFAQLIDQKLLYHGEMQYYYSYPENLKIKVSELNTRRKSIGLPSYGYEMWRNKKMYPEYFK